MPRRTKSSELESEPPRASAWSLLGSVLTLGGLLPFSSWLALGLVAGAWYSYERVVARPPMAWMGEPQPQDPQSPATFTRTLRNQGYLLGYSDLRGNPLWAIYALNPAQAAATAKAEPGNPLFTDWRAFNWVRQDHYSGSGYEPGLLVPSLNIGWMYGKDAQIETAVMTNASPQKKAVFDKLWRRLAAAELDPFAKQFGKLWIVAGPIFDPPLERLRTSWRVEVPDAFFKILIAPDAKTMLAFIIPQTAHGDEPLEHFVTSVDAIEKRSGLDFFPDLDDADENRLESEINPAPWHLHELNRQPGRPKPAPVSAVKSNP